MSASPPLPRSRSSLAGAALVLVASVSCLEDRETAFVSLDFSACFLLDDGLRGGGENAGRQAGRAGQDPGGNHFGGEAICRYGLQAYLDQAGTEQVTVCLAIRFEESDNRVCRFSWNVRQGRASDSSCRSARALPELAAGGSRVTAKPFFLKAGVDACPGVPTVGTTCADMADCLFALQPVSETLAGDEHYTLAYGYDAEGGLTACTTECGSQLVERPDGIGRVPICWGSGVGDRSPAEGEGEEGEGEPEGSGGSEGDRDSPLELCDAEWVSDGAGGSSFAPGVDNDCDGEVDEDFSVIRDSAEDPGVAGDCAYVVPGTDRRLALGDPCQGTGECGQGTIICGVRTAEAGCGDSAGRYPCCSADPGCMAPDDPGGRSDELCDGLDNDCDGETDEDSQLLGLRPGSVTVEPIRLHAACDGEGACGVGRVVCRQDGSGACCSSEPGCCGPVEGCEDATDRGQAEDEVCDGLDNDCDGHADEELTYTDARSDVIPLGQPCSTGQCKDGFVRCGVIDGEDRTCCSALPECGGPAMASEVCDGLDNDCDGETDEDFPGLGEPCSGRGRAADGGDICPLLDGVVTCAANRLETCCTAYNATGEDADTPSAECVPPGWVSILSCDGREEPGEREACRRLELPRLWGNERCDGLDNDCDGRTDEDFLLAGGCNGSSGVCLAAGGIWECRVCTDESGEEVPCEAGLSETVCSVDPGGSESAALGAEVCDGVFDARTRSYLGQDDDCDGVADPDERAPLGGYLFSYVDDGVPTRLGFPCNKQGLGICGPGIVECDLYDFDGDELTVTRCSTLPGGSESPFRPELCDGLDNDCDGETDEDYRDEQDHQGLGDPCRGRAGICSEVWGVFECAGDRLGLVCSVDPGGSDRRDVPETCDHRRWGPPRDEDCDGRTWPTDDDPGAPDERDLDGDGSNKCEEVPPLALCCVGAASGCERQDPDQLPHVSPYGPYDAEGNPDPSARGGELCDGIDNDCSGLPGGPFDPIDESDDDGDGFMVCENDCDDRRWDVSPDGTERCDAFARSQGDEVIVFRGADEDCDFDSEEDWPALGGRCGFGVCAGGFLECNAAGDGLRCSTEDGGSEAREAEEVCDGLDDDCDGAVPADELDVDGDHFLSCGDRDNAGVDPPRPPLLQLVGIPGLGRDELVRDDDCDDSRGDVYPGAPEVCDGRDNDCDLVSDREHFRFEGNPDHCGGCNNSCDDWFADREGHVLVSDCVMGVCAIACAAVGADPCPAQARMCEEGYYDLNGDPGDGCEYGCWEGDPLADDEPDSLADDTDCDGMDGDRADAIFVAAGGPDGDGSMARPRDDLAAAYDQAVLEGKHQVIVASGVYTLATPLVLAPGVGVYGGYCVDCGRQTDADGTTIWSHGAVPQDTVVRLEPGGDYEGIRVVVIGKDLARPTSVGRLTLVSADGVADADHPARRSSAAVLAQQSGVYLRLRDVILEPGDGADGPSGPAGGSGGPGGAGWDGGDAVENDYGSAVCATDAPPAGGTGGDAAVGCGAPSPDGGRGGVPGFGVDHIGGCNLIDEDLGDCRKRTGTDGVAGRDARDAVAQGAGAGGSAGWAGSHDPTDDVPDGSGEDGGTGQRGGDGSPGQPGGGRGSGATTIQEGTLLRFVGTADGAVGGDGRCGGGGGGGGGGAGGTRQRGGVPFPGCRSSGGAGGGGGGGGHGGAGGSGGGGGGASVGVVLSFSGVTIQGSQVGLLVRPGRGGDGGACGQGGAGGRGGAGGMGGARLSVGSGVESGEGGDGGDGGDGGSGGAGGGGGGGPSVGVLRAFGAMDPVGMNRMAVSYYRPGAGGGSPGPCLPDPGAAGVSGVTGACADPTDDDGEDDLAHVCAGALIE